MKTSLLLRIASCAIVLSGLTATASAQSAEVCGNGVDDDNDGFADESCYPGLTNPLVDSPLSTSDTGLISPTTGALYYAMPADIAARTPYGPGLSFRRTYVSMHNPGASPPAYRKPMGDRWIHNFMSWIDDYGSTLIIHMPSGQEIKATLTSSCVYETHGGAATGSLSHCAGGSYTLNMLDRTSMFWTPLVVGGPPMLTAIRDSNVSPLGIGLTYNGSSQVTDVSDMSGHRTLHFTYTSNLLTSVELRVDGVTQHTTNYAYTGNNLTSVTIGGQLAQTNSYTSNYLTQIADGAGNALVKFAYDSATAGKAIRVDTPRGMVGFEFASTRTSCSGAVLRASNVSIRELTFA